MKDMEKYTVKQKSEKSVFGVVVNVNKTVVFFVKMMKKGKNRKNGVFGRL